MPTGQTKTAARSVLIVDDEPHVRTYLAKVCQSLGIKEIHEAADGEEGMTKCFGHAPDWVLVDINMPGMNGIELLGRIRNTLAGAKVILISSQATRERVIECIRLGARGFIRKDADLESLKRLLSETRDRG
jgi:DNA-binding NarL/FixJ family response regulator